MIKRPPWIAPRLRCGLGNRLFQVMAVIGEAERQGSKPVFFMPRMSHLDHGNFDLLRILCPTLETVETAYEWEDVIETSAKAIPTLDTDKPVVLSGFFQNSVNFPRSENPNLPRLPSLLESRPTVWAIHFRFGDYCILPHHQIHKLRQYYYQTIKKQIPSNTVLVLFSDSPGKLPAIAKELKGMGYEPEVYIHEDTLEILKAFSACQGGSICSNSTFAWWAAFFAYRQAQGQSYKAYFPDTWMTNQSTPNILAHPFTQSVELASLPPNPSLQSFSFYTF